MPAESELATTGVENESPLFTVPDDICTLTPLAIATGVFAE